MARIARSDDIHRAAPRAAVEGGNVVPDNSLIQGRVFHPRHESGCGEGFPFDMAHSTISGDGDGKPEVEAACAARQEPVCEVIVETELLETGGGIRNALPRLGPDPFVAVNGDSYWLNGPVPALRRLFAAFDPEAMDVLLLVARAATVEGDVGRGDFALDPLGRIRRPKEREVVPYTYAGVQVLHPRLFDGAPEGAWSMNRLYDKAIAAGRAFALVHDGVWFHLSTPEDLEQAEHRLQRGLVRFF